MDDHRSNPPATEAELAAARVILDEFSLEVTVPWTKRRSADAVLADVARQLQAWLPSLQAAVQAHHPQVEIQVSPLTPLIDGEAD